jgi:hypothetical protein
MKNDKIKLIDITKIRFSPEFEAELPARRDAEKLIERGRTLRGWNIKSDASLENGIELSPENSNHLYYNDDCLLQIKEVLALLRVYRAKINPERCGFHIHLNIKNLTDKQLLTVITEWIHRQKFIVKKFKVHPKRLDNTCKLLPKSNLHKLTEKQMHEFRNRKDYSFSYSELDEKYYSLNVNHMSKNDYGTIEFRLFGGSLNFKEIKERIYWSLCFLRDCLERE